MYTQNVAQYDINGKMQAICSQLKAEPDQKSKSDQPGDEDTAKQELLKRYFSSSHEIDIYIDSIDREKYLLKQAMPETELSILNSIELISQLLNLINVDDKDLNILQNIQKDEIASFCRALRDYHFASQNKILSTCIKRCIQQMLCTYKIILAQEHPEQVVIPGHSYFYHTFKDLGLVEYNINLLKNNKVTTVDEVADFTFKLERIAYKRLPQYYYIMGLYPKLLHLVTIRVFDLIANGKKKVDLSSPASLSLLAGLFTSVFKQLALLYRQLKNINKKKETPLQERDDYIRVYSDALELFDFILQNVLKLSSGVNLVSKLVVSFQRSFKVEYHQFLKGQSDSASKPQECQYYHDIFSVRPIEDLQREFSSSYKKLAHSFSSPSPNKLLTSSSFQVDQSPAIQQISSEIQDLETKIEMLKMQL